MGEEGLRRRKVRAILIVAALLCLVVAGFERRAIQRSPSYHPYLSDVTLITDVGDAGTVAILALLGGFRGAAANLLWLRSDYYWHMGATGWWKMRPIFDAITRLDPQFILAWRTFGWHVAWNLHADAPPEDKPKFLKEGEMIFRRGIHANPKSWEMRMELAWLFHDRIRDPEKAIPLWKDTIRMPKAPIYNWHMLAHAYERTLQWQKSLQVWQEVLKKDPGNPVARRYADMWERLQNDPQGLKKELRTIWEAEQAMRRSRGIPPQPLPPAIR